MENFMYTFVTFVVTWLDLDKLAPFDGVAFPDLDDPSFCGDFTRDDFPKVLRARVMESAAMSF